METKTKRIAIIVALVGLTFVFLGVSLSSSDTSTQDANDSAITSVRPTPGGLHNIRGDVVVDLADGYQGRLVINSIDIPKDEIISIEGEGHYTFRPGKGKTIEAFEAGPNQAQVFYWPQGMNEPADAQSYTWDFQVSL